MCTFYGICSKTILDWKSINLLHSFRNVSEAIGTKAVRRLSVENKIKVSLLERFWLTVASDGTTKCQFSLYLFHPTHNDRWEILTLPLAACYMVIKLFFKSQNSTPNIIMFVSLSVSLQTGVVHLFYVVPITVPIAYITLLNMKS